MYWGRGIHYRGCTFITGGVHTRMHMYSGGASTTGGVPSYLGVCIPGHMCTGGGIHYRGCTFITGGVHTRMHMYWGGASTTGGIPS